MNRTDFVSPKNYHFFERLPTVLRITFITLLYANPNNDNDFLSLQKLYEEDFFKPGNSLIFITRYDRLAYNRDQDRS